MSIVISIQQASARLGELVRALAPGDEILLTDDDRMVATIVPSAIAGTREAGLWKGKFEIVDEGMMSFSSTMGNIFREDVGI